MRKIIVFTALILILIFVNWTIYQKETLLKSGKGIYLKLSPVDPRSLMEGDYMHLNFELTDKLNKITKNPGTVVLKLDKKGIATFKKLYKGGKLAPDEVIMKFKYKNRQSRLSSDAFFIEEGKSKKYSSAKYAYFKVSPDGTALLKDLADENMTFLSKTIH